MIPGADGDVLPGAGGEAREDSPGGHPGAPAGALAHSPRQPHLRGPGQGPHERREALPARSAYDHPRLPRGAHQHPAAAFQRQYYYYLMSRQRSSGALTFDSTIGLIVI